MYSGDKARIITHEEVREALFRFRAVVAAAFDTGRKMSVWGSDLEAVDLALLYTLQQKAKEPLEGYVSPLSKIPEAQLRRLLDMDTSEGCGKIEGVKL